MGSNEWPKMAQHHLGREDQRARVDLVLAGVLRRRAVRGLEHRDRVGEVRARVACLLARHPRGEHSDERRQPVLADLGWVEAADTIIESLGAAIEAKQVTYDFARLMDDATEVSPAPASAAR